MQNLHVSIVIPVYNEIKFIRKCLDSLINNDYPKDNVEILIFDGGSTDGTLEVFKGIGNKYIYYVDVKNEKCLVDLFIGNNLPKNNPNEVMAYLKSKFDVRVLAEKLISKIYEILEE